MNCAFITFEREASQDKGLIMEDPMSRRHATTRKILSEYAETTNRPESSFCNRSKDREGQFWHGNYKEMRFSAQHICSYSEIWVRKEGLGHGREDVKYSPWSQRSEFKMSRTEWLSRFGFCGHWIEESLNGVVFIPRLKTVRILEIQRY